MSKNFLNLQKSSKFQKIFKISKNLPNFKNTAKFAKIFKISQKKSFDFQAPFWNFFQEIVIFGGNLFGKYKNSVATILFVGQCK